MDLFKKETLNVNDISDTSLNSNLDKSVNSTLDKSVNSTLDKSVKKYLKNNRELVKDNETGYLNTRKQKWIFLINDVFERNSFFGNGPEYDRQALQNLSMKKK